jgi:hypothetical protein
VPVSEELTGILGDADREQLEALGIGLEDAARQLSILRDPTTHWRVLDRPATLKDGVRHIESRLIPDLLLAAESVRQAGRVSKFVPASGAATRMFQSLLRALDDYELGTIDEHGRELVDRFLSALPRLAIRHELIRRGISSDGPVPVAERDRSRLLYRILSATEVGLATRPKGLVPFHDDGTRGRTAFEEHLLEAVYFTTDAGGKARAHFTVSDETRPAFEAALAELRRPLEDASYATLKVSFSAQGRDTDTLCLGGDGLPARDGSGRLLLRPGGHGALLHNLQDTAGDLVVIKNIDNVVPPRRVHEIVHWKKVLIGYLVTLQESIHVYLRQIHENGREPHWLDQALVFAEQHLSIPAPAWLRDAGVLAKREFLVSVLDRPIRVCGVVRNQGEPGGGPFWVRDANGESSLQIVESAEVNLTDEEQASIWQSATFFNPVDIVVGLRNWGGKPFRLDRFSDPNAMIRTRKSNEGRPLTVLERPGLWNGAMSNWTTVFVEVPVSTFAPVKTVFDLLRPEHQ